jgi:hypothetical protein
MKKKIVVIVFLVLIAITVIIFSALAIAEHRLDAANGIDKFEGVGVIFLAIVGGYAVFYEIDLLFTVLYFFSKRKTKLRTVINLLSNICLLTVFFIDSIAHFLWEHVSEVFREEWIFVIILILLYFIFRSVYCLTSDFSDENQESA